MFEESDKQLSQEDLRFTISFLERRNKNYSNLLKTVAHDLKGPLSAIYGVAAIMLGDRKRPKEEMEMLELITDSVNSLTRTINDLLVFNIETYASDFEKEKMSLKELLVHSVNLLQIKANEKQQDIILSVKSSDEVFINRDSIWRVINNLIMNSIKFSENGTVIGVSAEKIKEMLVVCVKDQGIGIPENLKPEIFTLNNGSNRSGTLQEESFGLGLYISKQIIEAHGGKIWFESTENTGSEFYIALPVCR